MFLVYICTNCSDFLIAQLVKNLPEMQETLFNSWVGKICWRRDRLPTPVFLGFPCGSAGKESAWDAGDLGLIPGLGRSTGEGKGYPLQYSGLENSMDCIVRGVAKSWTRLSDFHFHDDFLELTPRKDVLFIMGLECKSRKSRDNRQIWPWSTEWSRAKANRENVLVIANTHFQQYKGQFYTWTSPDG